ncbi:MAG: hypothetical protein NT086_16960 [Proteobacteria bacterium]|nr:hypothetical protein [Pseudomonadota bacterium]
MNFAEKFEIHYYLEKNIHSMDALVRNKCEAELLVIFQEICISLDVNISIEVFAHQEGGLRDYWKFVGENANQITTTALIFSTLLSIISTVLSRLPVSDVEKDDREKVIQELVIEEKRLAVEEKKIVLEKLKKEMKDTIPSKQVIEDAARVTGQNIKIQTRRSNLYKTLSSHEKVTAIGFSAINQVGEPINLERLVPRIDFERYILTTTFVPVEIIDGAIVEIVAPVLKEGTHKWRGVYEGELINFSMIDSEFKMSVLREEVSFRHGSYINCVLQVFRKIDEVGEVVVTAYSVVTVVEKKDGSSAVETPQGKKYRSYKKFIKGQANLF